MRKKADRSDCRFIDCRFCAANTSGGPGPRRHHLDVDRQHPLPDGIVRRAHRRLHHPHPGERISWWRRGYAYTNKPWKPDVAAVARVLEAIGGPDRIKLLLTGHSHWDHSFDTATWSRLTGAPIIGSQTTCYEVMAENLPPSAAGGLRPGNH